MIVLLEDDVMIGRSVTQGLGAKGFAVRWLRRGAELAALLAGGDVEVLILDLGLPDSDGIALCRQLRAAGHGLPILMLTARGALDDRLEGFEAGADDYLPKPFAFAELVARVSVLARRAAQLPPAAIPFGPLLVDVARGEVLRNGSRLALEPKALALLVHLAKARGEMVSRQALMDGIWGAEAAVSSNTLDVCVSILRKRLAECAPEISVRAIKGQGLQLVCAIIP